MSEPTTHPLKLDPSFAHKIQIHLGEVGLLNYLLAVDQKFVLIEVADAWFVMDPSVQPHGILLSERPAPSMVRAWSEINQWADNFSIAARLASIAGGDVKVKMIDPSNLVWRVDVGDHWCIHSHVHRATTVAYLCSRGYQEILSSLLEGTDYKFS